MNLYSKLQCRKFPLHLLELQSVAYSIQLTNLNKINLENKNQKANITKIKIL